MSLREVCKLSLRFPAVVVLFIDRTDEKEQVSREKVLYSVLLTEYQISY